MTSKGNGAIKDRKSARVLIEGAFLRHREGLRRFIARLVIKPEDVDDILQDTFINAYGVADLGEIRSPKFYLYAIARRTAFRELKRQSRRMAQSIEDAIEKGDEPPAEEAPIDEAVHARAQFEALMGVVSEFPAQCRRVFILRKVLGYSHKEISDALGISISTVEKHLARAMMRCLQDHRLRAYGGSEAAASSGDCAAATISE